MKLRGFRPDPYEEDLRLSELRYCFGGDGGGGGGGGGGDDGSSGDDYGSDGFAGDTDASVGGGYASEGGNGESMSESGGPPSTADDPGTSTTGPMGDTGDYDVGVDTSDDVADGEGYTASDSDSALGEPDGYTGDWTNPDYEVENTADEDFTFTTEFDPNEWSDDEEAASWVDDSYAPAEDLDSIAYQFDLLNLEDPTQVDAQTAYDYSVVMGTQFAAPPGFSNDVYGVAAEPGMFEAGVTNVGQALGLVPEYSYVIDPSRPGDQIGQVTSDYSLVDAIVSAAIPGYTQDTMTATFPSGQTQGYGEASFGLGMGTGFGIGVGTGLTATNTTTDIGVSGAGTSQGGVGDFGGGDEGEDSVQSGETYQESYEESVAQATGRPRSKLLPQFLQQRTPNYVYYNQSSNPYAYYREGGKVQQMDELLANPLPVVDIAQVQKDPDSFLKNPESANSAEELEEIYKYNEYILEVSRQPIQAQEGMQVGQPAPEAQGGDGPMGFVGQKPEAVPDGDTVADDVPLDVEEGTFVINAAAVEFAGSEDIKKMIMEALAEAEKQGLDISGDGNKINKERQVSLLVSRGEVLIPPALAKIIGYDKLNKINNRGKEETEQRIAENGQAPVEQASNPAEGMAAAMGGDISDTNVIDIYSSIQNQGGDPGKFDTFRDAMDLYKGTKTYRPIEAQPGTPEFDTEVRDKYKLFFEDNPNPYMNKAERDAAKAKDKANMIDTSEPLTRVREDGTLYYIDRKTGKEVPAPKQEMSGGGFAESLAAATEKYAEREPQVIIHDMQMSDDRSNLAGEVIGDGFAVQGRVNKSEDSRSTEYPDGVVVDEENKNLGFALNGELYLFDDTWLNAGIEKQKGSVKGTANIPTGDKVMFGDQFEMTRYNMGATFGNLNFDVSGMPGEGIDRGRVKYKLNENRDELFIEGDKSGNISAGLRLSI